MPNDCDRTLANIVTYSWSLSRFVLFFVNHNRQLLPPEIDCTVSKAKIALIWNGSLFELEAMRPFTVGRYYVVLPLPYVDMFHGTFAFMVTHITYYYSNSITPHIRCNINKKYTIMTVTVVLSWVGLNISNK